MTGIRTSSLISLLRQKQKHKTSPAHVPAVSDTPKLPVSDVPLIQGSFFSPKWYSVYIFHRTGTSSFPPSSFINLPYSVDALATAKSEVRSSTDMSAAELPHSIIIQQTTQG